MADFTKGSVADMAAANPGVNMGTSGSMHEIAWGTEQWGAVDAHWREHYQSRPYVQADRGYEHYRPAYRYGSEAAVRHRGREWQDVEGDLERGWEAGRGESRSTWHEAKDAVRDAWDRMRGRGER